jgi:hypothetical protein
MTETVYGLTYSNAAPPRKALRRRHVVWAEGASKCGRVLVEPTEDMTLPLCGRCHAAMLRLRRERGELSPHWR